MRFLWEDSLQEFRRRRGPFLLRSPSNTRPSRLRFYPVEKRRRQLSWQRRERQGLAGRLCKRFLLPDRSVVGWRQAEMQKFLRPSRPGGAACRNWQFLRLSGARGSAASSRVRAVAPRPPRSCGQESLRKRILAKNLAYGLDHYCSRNLALPFSLIFRRGFG